MITQTVSEQLSKPDILKFVLPDTPAEVEEVWYPMQK
jgi:hypothetical protein